MTVAGNIVPDHRVVGADNGRRWDLWSGSDDQQAETVAWTQFRGIRSQPVGTTVGSKPVEPVPESDQGPLPSSLVARTCTS